MYAGVVKYYRRLVSMELKNTGHSQNKISIYRLCIEVFLTLKKTDTYILTTNTLMLMGAICMFTYHLNVDAIFSECINCMQLTSSAAVAQNRKSANIYRMR